MFDALAARLAELEFMNTRLWRENKQLKQLASDAHRRMDRMEDYINQEMLRKDPNRSDHWRRETQRRYDQHREQMRRLSDEYRWSNDEIRQMKDALKNGKY